MEPNNHEGPPQEQSKDTLRHAQRERLLEGITEDQRMFVQKFIPSERPTQVFPPGVRTNELYRKIQGNETSPNFQRRLDSLVDKLGTNTHTVLFGLAATASTPQELANIFIVLSQLATTGKSDILAKSQDLFVKRNQPKKIDCSSEISVRAKMILENLRNPKSGADRKGILAYFDPNQLPNSRTELLGSFLYIMSDNKIPRKDKSAILQQLYSLKQHFLFAALDINTDNDVTIFDRDVEFWKDVDGSWIDPNLSTQKRQGNKYFKNSDKPETADEKPKTDMDNELLRMQVEGLTANNLRLEHELSTTNAEKKLLQIRLQQAEQLIESSGPTNKNPFLVLGISSDASPQAITEAHRKITLALHPDQTNRKLDDSRLDPIAIAQAKNFFKTYMQEVNDAMEELRKTGKVK